MLCLRQLCLRRMRSAREARGRPRLLFDQPPPPRRSPRRSARDSNKPSSFFLRKHFNRVKSKAYWWIVWLFISTRLSFWYGCFIGLGSGGAPSSADCRSRHHRQRERQQPCLRRQGGRHRQQIAAVSRSKKQGCFNCCLEESSRGRGRLEESSRGRGRLEVAAVSRSRPSRGRGRLAVAAKTSKLEGLEGLQKA
jgi:hypothetical protein